MKITKLFIITALILTLPITVLGQSNKDSGSTKNHYIKSLVSQLESKRNTQREELDELITKTKKLEARIKELEGLETQIEKSREYDPILNFLDTLALVGLMFLAICHGYFFWKERNARLMIDVFEIVDDLQKQWPKVEALGDNYDEWNGDQNKLAETTSAQLQRIAYLTESRLLSKKHLLNNFYGIFIKYWGKLGKWVEHYQKETRLPQRIDFEKFVKKCEKHKEKLQRRYNRKLCLRS